MMFGGFGKPSAAKKIAPVMGVAAHKDVRSKVAPAVGAAPQMAAAREQQSNFAKEIRRRAAKRDNINPTLG